MGWQRSVIVVALGAVVAMALLLSPTNSTPAATAADPPLAMQPSGTLPLEGTPWRLRWYRRQGSERTPGPEVAATMQLEAGRLTASGGCTAFRGSYGTIGSAIAFELKGLKENECAEQTTMVQQALVDGLRKTASFLIEPSDEGDRLTLTSANGTELLRFGLDDLGRLAPTGWSLSAWTDAGGRHAVRPDFMADLSFEIVGPLSTQRSASGSALGSTGCNGFRATVERRASVITFGRLDLTDAPCPEALVEQQAAVLAVLQADAVLLSLPAERLVLAAPDGAVSLEYAAEPSLEGTNWLRLPVPRGDEAATSLRLENGEATGAGPCGPYRASYVTNGPFITFAAVRGSEGDGCDRLKEEQRLLAALRTVVRLERDVESRAGSPTLTLRDARGRRVLRFVYPYAAP